MSNTPFKKNNLLLFILISAVLAFLLLYFIQHRKKTPLRILPHFGEKKYGKSPSDTVYHRVADFEFINQNGDTINQESVKGKIYVADYFFVTCQSICPIMSKQMQRLAEHFRGRTNILFLSHTVNPEEDSVTVLHQYALKHRANAQQWLFLTGDKKKLYEMARKSYLLDAEEGNGGTEDFIHTQNFALIDTHRCIRGYYNGTDSTDVNRLITDIELLVEESNWENAQ